MSTKKKRSKAKKKAPKRAAKGKVITCKASGECRVRTASLKKRGDYHLRSHGGRLIKVQLVK